MKAAILGTEDYHATMRQIAANGLRYMVSYVPQSMNSDSQYTLLPPVHTDYLERVDRMMQELVGDNWLANCNSRSPYLVLAWLLIGSDYEYRVCQYIDDVRILKQAATIHIRIALGDIPAIGEIWDAVRAAKDNRDKRQAESVTWVAWSATWTVVRAAVTTWITWDGKAASAASAASAIGWNATIVSMAGAARRAAEDVATADDIAENAARTAIFAKARQWAHISDEQALQIARQLTFDILSL